MGYHMVWSTKYRRPVLTGRVEAGLKNLLPKLARRYDFQIKYMEIMPDHVHVFVSCHPKYPPSRLYKAMKGISESTIKKYIEDQKAAQGQGEPCGYGVQKRLLPIWKKEDDRLKKPSSQQLQEVVKEFHGALKSFFEKRKNGDTDCRTPSFRSSRLFVYQHFPQRYNSFEIATTVLR